jgi:hypothetical protein
MVGLEVRVIEGMCAVERVVKNVVVLQGIEYNTISNTKLGRLLRRRVYHNKYMSK